MTLKERWEQLKQRAGAAGEKFRGEQLPAAQAGAKDLAGKAGAKGRQVAGDLGAKGRQAADATGAAVQEGLRALDEKTAATREELVKQGKKAKKGLFRRLVDFGDDVQHGLHGGRKAATVVGVLGTEAALAASWYTNNVDLGIKGAVGVLGLSALYTLGRRVVEGKPLVGFVEGGVKGAVAYAPLYAYTNPDMVASLAGMSVDPAYILAASGVAILADTATRQFRSDRHESKRQGVLEEQRRALRQQA